MIPLINVQTPDLIRRQLQPFIKFEQQPFESSGLGVNQLQTSVLQTSLPEITYQCPNRLILPKGPLPRRPLLRKRVQSRNRKRKRKGTNRSIVAPLKNLIRCLRRPPETSKVCKLFAFDLQHFDQYLHFQVCGIGEQTSDEFLEIKKDILLTPIKKTVSGFPKDKIKISTENFELPTNKFVSVIEQFNSNIFTMLPSMPNLGTPIKSLPNQNSTSTRNDQEVSENLPDACDVQDFSKQVPQSSDTEQSSVEVEQESEKVC